MADVDPVRDGSRDEPRPVRSRGSPALLGFAWRNLWHQRTRSSVAIAGVALAIAVLFALDGLGRGYRDALDEDLDRLGFHVLVTAKGCPYETATLFLRGGQIPMYIDASLRAEIEADPDVASVAPLFLQAVEDAERGRHQVFMGIDESFLAMRPWLALQRGAFFSGDLVEEAVVGWTVAEFLELELGDEIDVPGTRARLRVVGVLDRAGTQDDGTVFLPLRTAQLVFDKQHRFTGLGVRLHDLTRLDAFVERAYAVPGVQPITLAQVRGTVLGLVESARGYIAAVSVVALVVAFLGVLNVMSMSVVQRMREFGVMRVMGASPGDLFELIAAETVSLSVAGAALGVALVALARRPIEALMRGALPFAPRGDLLGLEAWTAVQALGLAAVLGLLAALWPARRASRSPPVSAMRWMR